MTAAFEIRVYAAGDAAAISRLYYDSARKLGARAYSPEQVEAWAPAPLDAAAVHRQACDGRLTLVAVDSDGAVAAYADLEPDGHVDHLYCRPDAAGQGLASRLLAALTEHATAQGMTRLYAEASELARPVFERHGFRTTARRDFELRGVAIHNYAVERRLTS